MNTKITITLPASLEAKSTKPRNPFAIAARQRRAGAHGASQKALRQQSKQRLKQDLPKLLAGE